MGKNSRRNKRTNSRSVGTSSLAEAFQRAAELKDDSQLTKELASMQASQQEQRANEERSRRLDDKTRRLLLLPHVSNPKDMTFTNPLESGFVNPYTFFALEQVHPQKWDVDARDYSGKLTCSLEVQDWSPLFVPNTSGVFKQLVRNAQGKDGIHRCYDFYSYKDLSEAAASSTTLPNEEPLDPVIPGSELRGMTRSVYEQLTNSCLPIIDEKSNPIKRTNLPKKPYRMEYDHRDGVWKLYDTDVYCIGAPHHHDDFSYTDKRGMCARSRRAWLDVKGAYERQTPRARQIITMDLSSSFTSRSGARYVRQIGAQGFVSDGVDCYLHVTGEIGRQGVNHNHLVLFSVANEQAGRPLATVKEEDDLFRRFMRVVNAYCEPSTSKNHNDAVRGYEAYRELLRAHETVLVYADNGDDPKYLSPSSLSPESYDTKVLDLLGEHAPCSGPNFCPACRLFGMVGKQGSLGSRVRFTDGHVASGSAVEFCAPTTLAPLSSPRPSATEFYLAQPVGQEGLWNFDYLLRGEKDSRGKYVIAKHPTAYRMMEGSGLQGRKVYLHSRFDLQAHYDSSLLAPSMQNITVRPLRKGTFEFDVYFEDLTAAELANLVYAIGGMGEGRLQKLGHGRPLGMGSVRVKVTACETKEYAFDGSQVSSSTRTLDADWMSKNLPQDDDGRNLARRKMVTFLARDLRDVSYGTSTLGDAVSYPKPRPGKLDAKQNTTYAWFGRNRGTVQRPTIKNVLNVLSVEEVMGDADWEGLPS